MHAVYALGSTVIRGLIACVWVGVAPVMAQSSPPTSNPAASQTAPGTGELGRLLGLPADGALRIGGVWVGNGTSQWSGGVSNQNAVNGVQQLLLEASLDLGKAIGLDHTWIWIQGLQVNATTGAGQVTGSMQGANSLTTSPPLNRSELFEFAIRKDFLDGRLRVIAGKQSTSITFANINRPDKTDVARYQVDNLTSLAFTPIYSMPTLLGRLPGYTNSALGLTITAQPDVLDGRAYFSAGVYDGRGGLRDASVQTGLDAPSLSGPLFSIAEAGSGWVAGKARKPGSFGLGAWSQGGESVVCQSGSTTNCFTELGAWGVYALLNQRLSSFRPQQDSSGISGFLSAGWSPSISNQMGASVTAGFTAMGPLGSRPNDSIGVGVSWAKINRSEPFLEAEFNPNELMLQGYAQIALADSLYFQPTVTVLPLVGDRDAEDDSVSGLLQLTMLF
ncbi:carbohydrate porin [Synechococcus sp. UW179A]|uniref:carbohydrate porin n=1 Tax=Synechococcus sp. UW179A TaxID=2575510 RepID=UPI001FCA4B29|nr:carbohydrate porin [Synechococcus sp. UW179A]